jgi:hypothetical protein
LGGRAKKRRARGAEFPEICLRISSHNYRGEQGTSTAGPEDRTLGPKPRKTITECSPSDGKGVIQRRDGATGKKWTGSTKLGRSTSKREKECCPPRSQTGRGEVRRTGEGPVRMPDGSGCSPLDGRGSSPLVGQDKVQSAGRKRLQSACRTGQDSVRRAEEVAVRMPDGSSPPDETGPGPPCKTTYYNQSSQLLVRPPGSSRAQILAGSTLGWGREGGGGDSLLNTSDIEKLIRSVV